MNIDQANAWRAAVAAQEKQRAECAAAWQEAEQRQREQADAIVNHRLRHPDIAYSFRPLSYWEIPGSPIELVLRNVKGTRRREMIRDFCDQGRQPQTILTRSTVKVHTSHGPKVPRLFCPRGRSTREPVGQRTGEPMEAKVYPFRWFLSRALLRQCVGEDIDGKNEGTVLALDQLVDATSPPSCQIKRGRSQL